MALGVSPERVREVRFAEQWRGYRTDEVDEFVEQVAEAFDQLEARVRESSARAAEAERRLLERGPDEDLSRTLVLAQRTADLAQREAEAEAARVVHEAQARARLLVEEAEARRERLDQESEARMASELHDVIDRKAVLERDVASLQSFVMLERRRLVDELRQQLAWLDQPGRLDPLSPPALESQPEVGWAPVPEAAADSGTPPIPEFDTPVAFGDAFAADVLPEDGVLDDAVLEDAGPEHALPEHALPEDVLSEEGLHAEALPEERQAFSDPSQDDTILDNLELPWLRTDEDETDEDQAEDQPDADMGIDDQGIGPVPRAAPEPVANAHVDPFIAELQRAAEDPEPLGPRDDVPPPSEWSDDDDVYDEGRRFRRRRPR